MGSGRSRNFSIVTYLNKTQIERVKLEHFGAMRAFAYILHDKDVNEDGEPKEAHYHILIAKINASTQSAIKQWFSGFEDDNGNKINTFIQPLNDCCAGFSYLTHADSKDKYQYSPNDVNGFNFDFFTKTEEQEKDTLTLALGEMLNGTSVRDLCFKYGRDFIIHYASIYKLYRDIKLQEKGVDIYGVQSFVQNYPQQEER